METGKVEYAPDYKSKSQVKRIAIQSGAQSSQQSEHQRLQSAVVEAAKRRAVTSYTAFEMWNAIDIAFDDAVDALIAFEAEHKIGEG